MVKWWARAVLFHALGGSLAAEDGEIRASTILRGYHKLSREWPLAGRTDGYVYVEDMYAVILRKRLTTQRVDLGKVCHKDMSSDPSLSIDKVCGRKDANAERNARGAADVPGVLVRDGDNPCGLKYRMIDGAHRICRLKHAGETSGAYFVLDADTAKSLVVDSHAKRAHELSKAEALDLGWYLRDQYYNASSSPDGARRLRRPLHRRS